MPQHEGDLRYHLSETNQSQKDKYTVIPLTRGIKNSQIPRNRNWSGFQGLGKGKLKSCLMGIRCQFFKTKRIQKIGCTIMWMYFTIMNFLTSKNGKYGTSYTEYFLPQFKKLIPCKNTWSFMNRITIWLLFTYSPETKLYINCFKNFSFLKYLFKSQVVNISVTLLSDVQFSDLTVPYITWCWSQVQSVIPITYLTHPSTYLPSGDHQCVLYS